MMDKDDAVKQLDAALGNLIAVGLTDLGKEFPAAAAQIAQQIEADIVYFKIEASFQPLAFSVWLHRRDETTKPVKLFDRKTQKDKLN